ncbi:hypothetical protein [Streptomyces sp. NRRL S-495]|uniref:hypothetical protein n=1 Tax=Streptomyces sp. NRRL S-495 TaxID=1609133 RepID=UPI0005F94273|nr:hypothetical protein [Streptomyces sp. NRRL S-495]KJY32139.1 hypothetical protein VR45_23255 [Streptomyces sp. NRRL S-495]
MTTLFEPPATSTDPSEDLREAVSGLVGAYTGALADIADLIRSRSRLSEDLDTARLRLDAAARRETELAAEYGAAVLERDAARTEAQRTRGQLADLLPVSLAGVDLGEIRTVLARAHRPRQDEEQEQSDRADLAWAVTVLLPLAEAAMEPRPGTAAADRAASARQRECLTATEDTAAQEVAR